VRSVPTPAVLNALSVPAPPVKQVVEGALMAAGGPLTVDQILGLYPDDQRPPREEVRDAVAAISDDYHGRGIELVEVAGGWRIQVRREVAPWVGRLWEERPARYSRALLETLALIAYRQPITRGEIEDIRGVAVSTQIVKTLSERDWIRIVGHRDVPGRPALFATTRRFLDYFGLRSLNDLPPLAEIRDPSFFADALDLQGGSDGADESDNGRPPARLQVAVMPAGEPAPDIDSPAEAETETETETETESGPTSQAASDRQPSPADNPEGGRPASHGADGYPDDTSTDQLGDETNDRPA
jgi:segregation and condensation protein B